MIRSLTNFAVLLAGVVASCCPASPTLAQPFIGDVNRWKAQDALDPPRPGAILFIGSSSIRRWEQLALDFADYYILQRGFGGSQFEDVNRYVNDIVLPYQPSAIVVWEGTNDVNSGEDGAEVFADYQNFVRLVHAAQPGTPIFWLGIMPTPGRFHLEAVNTVANTSIKNFAAGNPALHYVDLPAAFHALNPPKGADFQALFVDDIHLNRQGYELWTRVVRPRIEAVVAPNKVFTPNRNTPQPGAQILFDFGPNNSDDGDHTVGADAHGRVWNNWHEAEGNVAVNAGEHLANLVDVAGAATGVNLTVTGGFSTNGKRQGGLLNPDAKLLGELAVATATQDYFFSSADNKVGGGDDDRPGGFVLDGLDPHLAYDFRFFGSRNTSQTRNTEYRVIGANEVVAALQTSGNNIGADRAYDGNDNPIAIVAGVRPDEFGQTFVDITLLEGDFAYVAAMEITVVVAKPSAAIGAVSSQ